jgi:hypothetical protein
METRSEDLGRRGISFEATHKLKITALKADRSSTIQSSTGGFQEVEWAGGHSAALRNALTPEHLPFVEVP